MSRPIEHFRRATAGAALLALAACGGGGGGESAAVVVQPLASATTNVSTTVVDGAIKNAVVCVDKNSNGMCDAGETQGSTDANGKVTLAVPNADLGKYPIIAMVGTDAIDADHGPVTTAYAMSAPADQAAVVSPLTTLVQQTVASTGATTAEAAASVQAVTGITASLFQDFTKATAPTDGSVNAAVVARMLVVTTQQQASAIASTLGKPALDDVVITKEHLDKAIQKKLLELLPALVTALSNPAVLAATSPADKEAALLAAAATLVTSAGLTPAGVATAVAINSQNASPTPVAVMPPSAALSLDTLTFAGASNYLVRTLGSSVAQNTPDASNTVKYVERRSRSVAGSVARWGSGSDPARNADLSWNGTAWVACPINFENTSSVRDALGNSVYSYCGGRETGKSSRASFDIGGKTLTSVYAQIVGAGYTNIRIDGAPALLGTTATFPIGASLFYQTTTALTEAISYYPAGANSPPGTSYVVSQYSAAVSAGGTVSSQADGTGCNAFTVDANGKKTYERDTSKNSTTLDGMIAANAGTPCVYPTATFPYGGTTYSADEPNAGWGAATASLGKIGTAALGSGKAPGFYSGNVWLRAAFTGGNAVTYYACKERFDNGSIRACNAVGTGTYAIATLGDARVLTFNNPPLQAAALTYNRVFVERGGAVYYGYQGKPTVYNKALLNLVATGALLNQLGLTVDDPSVPLALTAGSYQGVWDMRRVTQSVTGGVSFLINGNGNVLCQNRSDSTFFTCAVAITNASTGAFTFSNNLGDTAAGNFNFQMGSASGVDHDPTGAPADSDVVGARR